MRGIGQGQGHRKEANQLILIIQLSLETELLLSSPIYTTVVCDILHKARTINYNGHILTTFVPWQPYKSKVPHAVYSLEDYVHCVVCGVWLTQHPIHND